MYESRTVASRPRTAFSTSGAALLGLSAGLLAHLPWLVLSRVDAMRTFAVAMSAVFLFFDPWLTIPLIARVRRAAGATRRAIAVFAVVSGGVAGLVSALTIVTWERFRTGVWLDGGDLAAQLVYPALAMFYALVASQCASFVWRRRGGSS